MCCSLYLSPLVYRKAMLLCDAALLCCYLCLFVLVALYPVALYPGLPQGYAIVRCCYGYRCVTIVISLNGYRFVTIVAWVSLYGYRHHIIVVWYRCFIINSCYDNCWQRFNDADYRCGCDYDYRCEGIVVLLSL